MDNSKKDRAIRQGDLYLIKLDAALASFLKGQGIMFSNKLQANTDKMLLKGENSTHEHALIGGKVVGFNEPVSFDWNGKPVEVLEIFQGGVISHRDVNTKKPFRQNHDSLKIDDIAMDIVLPDESPSVLEYQLPSGYEQLWVAYRQVGYQPEGYRRAVD